MPLNFALLFGLITGAIIQFPKLMTSADWAAKGQPVTHRWIDEQLWFIEGFIPGAVFGVFIGLIYAYISDKHNKNKDN